MIPSTFPKKMAALFLSFCLLAGLLPVSAMAADSKSTSLADVAYYGDVSQCRMSSEMAQAYAEVLSSTVSKEQAILVDLAGDGMPLLFTAWLQDTYSGTGETEVETLCVWTWDGTRAVAHDFDKDFAFDAESGYASYPELGKYSGTPAICVRDGERQDVIGAEGKLYYKIQNADLFLLRHEMNYTAMSEDGVSALVPRIPYPVSQEASYYDTVEKLQQEGWVFEPWGAGSKGGHLYRTKVDGQFLAVSSFQEWKTWQDKAEKAWSPIKDPFFTDELAGVHVLQGKWSAGSAMREALLSYTESGGSGPEQGGSFPDVRPNDWFYDAVQYVYGEGMMTGMEDGSFAPRRTTTRAQIVTILHRMAGSPAEGNSSFSDVSKGDWYAKSVNWAASNQIVGGYENGTFAPQKSVTREEMATILYRFAKYMKLETGVTGDLSEFSDSSTISPWAKTAMEWAVGQNILNGSNHLLLPKGNATRAQIAQIFMNFSEQNGVS